MSAALETRRQDELLAVLRGAQPSAAVRLAEQGERLGRGLAAYRANAATIAARSLVAAYPTLHALVGEDDFAALARALWRHSPPIRGDLAQWGGDLAEFIEAERDLDPWPYLADCARLDALVMRCESAADAVLERDSLALLAERAPDELRLCLLPSVQLLSSAWPVASVHAAHRQGVHGDDERTASAAVAFAAARRALDAGRGEAVLVARSGWRAVVHVVDPCDFAWMQSLQRGDPLADALAAAGDAFDFNAWLMRSLQQAWLWRAEAIDREA